MSVTLGSFTYPYAASYSDPVTLRIWYTGCHGLQFIDVDGEAVACGSSDTFYIDIPCTLVDSVITIPATVLPTTDDSQTASVLATAQFFVAGSPRDFLFESWVITSTLGASLTFDQLWIYNLQVTPAYTLSPSYLTSPQVAALIAFAVINVVYGSIVSVNSVPRATAANTLEDGLAIDDGTNFSIPSTGVVQLGDYNTEQNGSFISVDDALTTSGGRANLYAGGADAVEYAGVSADCSLGQGEISLQTTGITNVYGANQITTIGDGKNEQQGTQVVVNDPTRMVVQTVANQMPNDPSILPEQVCFYLDEMSEMLKARIRKTTGDYVTAELSYNSNPLTNSAPEGFVPRTSVDGNLEAGSIVDAPTTGNPSGQLTISGPIGTDQVEAGTTLGTVTGFIEVFDADGVSLGKLPIYDDIT